ncbi:MAG: hypothetical protein CMM07_22455 [Rhodopirellula sp.]|nr:hypothetical protein [Rhodopirellula sp.]
MTSVMLITFKLHLQERVDACPREHPNLDLNVHLLSICSKLFEMKNSHSKSPNQCTRVFWFGGRTK